MPKLVAIDPFNRLEGDLRVEIIIEDNRVTEAKSSGILFRGFERILPGRDPMDALVITPRICGICSASHGIAAAKALAHSMSADLPANAYFMRNIILAAEVVMSHLSHYYLLFSPDFTNRRYKDLPFFQEAGSRFTPLKGAAITNAVRARQSMLEIMGLVAGKWPNSLAVHPGGTTSTMNLSSLTRALGILREFDMFLEKSFLGCRIDEWLDIDSFDRLERWLEAPAHQAGDLGFFIKAAFRIGLDRIGRGPVRFLSYGAYDEPLGGNWLPSGFYDGGSVQSFDQERIQEHITASFFRDAVESRHPLAGVTNPFSEKKDAYSWSKAPRYNGKTVEVGPLARLVMAQEPLITDMVGKFGVSVFVRMFARLQEMVKLVRQLNLWLERINPNEPFFSGTPSRYSETGFGLVEAARGGLGHWIRISSSFIESYQVVTPSAWNMSPRDNAGHPGPVEEALTGCEVADSDNPVEVNHIIRSFDPCMSCTVH